MDTKLKKQIDSGFRFLDDVGREMSKIILGETSRRLYRAFALGLIAPLPYTPKPNNIEARTGCGHIWLEAVPGTGKTLAAEGFALMSKLCDGMVSQMSGELVYKRIQFTSETMPGHILGFNVFDEKTKELRLVKGPIFANIVLIDENRRGNPHTKSALLEVMQERQVTIENETFVLPPPFFVIATDNPLEERGVFPTTVAENDRYMSQVVLSELSKEEEKMIVSYDFSKVELEKIVTASKIMEIRKIVREEVKWDSDKIPEYIVRLIRATRHNGAAVQKVKDYVQWGIFSNRCLQHFFAAAKAQAFFNGRTFVKPEDIKQVAHEIMRHRITLKDDIIGTIRRERKFVSQAADEVITAILEEVPIP